MILTELPRLFQIEVGQPPVRLSDEQVKGGFGDGVDAGDVVPRQDFWQAGCVAMISV